MKDKLLQAKLNLGAAQLALYAWDESKHPRHGKGDEKGGKFAPGSGLSAKDRAMDRQVLRDSIKMERKILEGAAAITKIFPGISESELVEKISISTGYPRRIIEDVLDRKAG